MADTRFKVGQRPWNQLGDVPLTAYERQQRHAVISPATHAESERQYRAKRLSAISMWKLERGCADCGYDKSPHALDFDHPPGTKTTEVSKLYRFKAPIERIIEEMEKCEVVCANCHRIRTVERGGWGQ